MPIRIEDRGRHNVVAIAPELLEQGSGTVILEGDRNTVAIAAPVWHCGIHFQLTGGAEVTVGEQVSAHSLFVHATRNSHVRIGRQCGFNGQVRLLLLEPGRITIGDGCLFAGGVDVTISDMHSVLDATTRQRINPARDIAIGDHVWIGERAMVLKGVEIGAGSIVGAASVVTRTVPPSCAAAGNPARVVRRNVTWDFRLL